MRKRIQRTVAILGTTALTVLACSSGTQGYNDEISSRAPVTLEVTNDNHQDITVYVTDGGQRWRLGMVTTGQTLTFTVPSSMTNPGIDFEVLIHLIGGGEDFRTGRVLVSPGSAVELRVAPVVTQTSYMVS